MAISKSSVDASLRWICSGVLNIEAGRAMGFSDIRIMVVHILPNILGEILVMASLWIATAVRIEASGTAPVAGAAEILLSESTDVYVTILSAIFMPSTLLAGIWGMNFEWMPELKVPFAYPIALGLMGLIGTGMYLFFRRKGWLD